MEGDKSVLPKCHRTSYFTDREHLGEDLPPVRTILEGYVQDGQRASSMDVRVHTTLMRLGVYRRRRGLSFPGTAGNPSMV